MKAKRFTQQNYGSTEFASATGFYTPNSKQGGELYEVDIRTINKNEAIKYAKEHYPNFKFVERTYPSTKNHCSSYKFRRC